jgi:hypothetical protein
MHAPKNSTTLAATVLAIADRLANPSTIVDQLQATTRAVAAADEAYLHDAIESVSWERRGFLQRLTRPGGPESLRFE